MKLRGDDKKWVQQEVVDQIQAAIAPVVDSLSPHGWRKAAFVLRELGPLIGTISVILALVAITLGALYQSWGHVKEEATFRQRTDDRLTLIEKDIKAIQNSVTLASFKVAVSGPPNRETARTVTTILQTATRGKMSLPSDDISEGGQKFIAASSKIPEAWGASLAFLDYRSFLNIAEAPKLKDGKPDESFAQRFGSHIRTPKTGNYEEAIHAQQALLFGDLVTDNFAVMERMEGPLNATKGYQFIVYRIQQHPESELVLDGLHMRNVIVENTTVTYLGGEGVNRTV